MDNQLETALRLLHRTSNQSAAAKEAGISTERFRRFLRENTLAERRGRQWHITDHRLREMTVISGGEAKTRRLRGFDQSSLNGKYLSAVGQALSSGEWELMLPFEGVSITDAKGRALPLETDPNTLHRIAHEGDELFHNVYRLVT